MQRAAERLNAGRPQLTTRAAPSLPGNKGSGG